MRHHVLALTLCTVGLRAVAAEPRPQAPPATTPASPGDGVTLAPLVKLPATPGFKPRAPRWWKAKNPCPAGTKPKRMNITSEYKALVCQDRDGKQHGPGVAVFATTDEPFEDSWSVHGVEHGTRWTWQENGKLAHTESYVDGIQQGPSEEWSGPMQISAGAYLDGKKHGAWTYRCAGTTTGAMRSGRGSERARAPSPR
jgi:plastocyanin